MIQCHTFRLYKVSYVCDQKYLSLIYMLSTFTQGNFEANHTAMHTLIFLSFKLVQVNTVTAYTYQ